MCQKFLPRKNNVNYLKKKYFDKFNDLVMSFPSKLKVSN